MRFRLWPQTRLRSDVNERVRVDLPSGDAGRRVVGFEDEISHMRVPENFGFAFTVSFTALTGPGTKFVGRLKRSTSPVPSVCPCLREEFSASGGITYSVALYIFL